MPEDTTTIEGQGTDLPENTATGSVNPEGSEGEKPAVPYTRFHEVNTENKTLKERVSEYEQKISEYKQAKPVDNTKEQSEVGKWTKKAMSSKDWDELIEEVQVSTIERYEKAQLEKTERASLENQRAEKILLDELQELIDEGAIKTENDKNSLIKFAIEQSNKYGVSIPLKLASQLMNGQQGNNERNTVASKVQSSKRSSGVTTQSLPNYKRSFEQIIYEAKQNAPK